MTQPQQQQMEVPASLEPPEHKARETAQLAQALAAGISAYRGRDARRAAATQEAIRSLDAEATATALPRPMGDAEAAEARGVMRAVDENPVQGRWARAQDLRPAGRDGWSVVGGADGLLRDIAVVVETQKQADALVEGIKDPEILPLEQLYAMQRTDEPVAWDRREQRAYQRIQDNPSARREALVEVIGGLDRTNPGDQVLLERLGARAGEDQAVLTAVHQRRQAWQRAAYAEQGQATSASSLAPEPSTPAAGTEQAGPAPEPAQAPPPVEASGGPQQAEPEPSLPSSGPVPAAEEPPRQADPAPTPPPAEQGQTEGLDLEIVPVETERDRAERLTQRFPRPLDPVEVRSGGRRVPEEELDVLVLDRVGSMDPDNETDCKLAAGLFDVVGDDAQQALVDRFGDDLAEAMAEQPAPAAPQQEDPHTANLRAAREASGLRGKAVPAAANGATATPDMPQQDASQQEGGTTGAGAAPAQTRRSSAPQVPAPQQTPTRSR